MTLNEGDVFHGIQIEAGPFLSRDSLELYIGRLLSVELAAESNFFDNLALSYRDIFGHSQKIDKSGWGEYIICKNCANINSIEDIHDTSEYKFLGELEKNGIPNLPKCEGCNSEMELFYEPSEFIKEIRRQIAEKGFWGIFAFDKQLNVYGFYYAWVDKLKELWQEKISELYTYSTLSYESFLEQISQNTNGVIGEDTNLLYLAEAGQVFNARGSRTLFAMFKAFFESLDETTMSSYSLTAITPEKETFLYATASQQKVVCEATDTPLKTLIGKTQDLSEALSLPPKDFFRRHKREISNWRIENQTK